MIEDVITLLSDVHGQRCHRMHGIGHVFVDLEHVGLVGKKTVSGYGNRRLKLLLHQNVVSLRKTLHPRCFSRLSCEMSTRRDHPIDGFLLSAMSSPKEIAIKSQRVFHCRGKVGLFFTGLRDIGSSS